MEYNVVHMGTIIAITRKDQWEKAIQKGNYTRSTIHQALEEVGFIHCTSPDQTMEIIPRFADQKDVILLLIDTDKVIAPLKYESPKSGRAGLFPHIYGPLNIDAVYETVEMKKDKENNFIKPAELTDLIKN